MAVRFALDTFLKHHGLTAYRLVQETEGLVARGSVFAMARSESVKRIDLANLNHILSALSALTGMPVQLADLFSGETSSVGLRTSAAGVPYTEDPETNAILDEHPDILLRLAEVNAKEGGRS